MYRRSAAKKWLFVAIFSCGAVLSAAAQAVVTYTLGPVEIVRDGRTITAEIGSAVRQDDIIRTGEGATAIVELADGAEIKLRAESRVRLDSLSEELTVELQNGGLFSRIVDRSLRGSYSVKTSTVVAGVRGTEFFVAFGRSVEERADVWLCVNEGVVDVQVPQEGASTDVEAGEGINILSGSRLTEPRFYQWTTELNWNMNPEEGEVSDDTDLDRAYSDLLDQDYD